MYKILDKVNSPSDLKGLTKQEIKNLCSEVRDYMVHCCAENPGHLASSLGAVEIITALHYVYNTPDDKVVFDVGHQAYVHKILTGRKEEFKACRTEGCISGFPRRDESPYDAFGVGHSSTSISAALGFAEAARISGAKFKSVAVIGDGALTGGLAFEGLNNAGASSADLLVIVNDNNQSIDPNNGGLHRHLLSLTTSTTYNRIKNAIWESMGEGKTRNFFRNWARSLKSWFVKSFGGDLFESLGFRYFGPIDGNDIEKVIRTLSRISELKGPRVLHCITRKGKGYDPAEEDPVTWHAPGKFNPETGARIISPTSPDRFQDVFGETLMELALMDKRVVGITPAMASGCGMSLLKNEIPERFFDVGIEEEHAVTFSAGLAASGMKPFCNIYSSFSQRAYDQIIHDVALQKLPVVLCFDRAGVVGEDGATHTGAFDMAAYRSIPNCIIASPRNEPELRQMMYTALQSESGPFIIRYPRGSGDGSQWRGTEFRAIEVGRAEKLLEGDKVAIITIGPTANSALQAARRHGGQVGVYDFKFLKPLDKDTLKEIGGKFEKIITVEDGCLKGGLYGAVCEYYAEALASGELKNSPVIVGHGIPDKFIDHARQSAQKAMCGIDSESIAASIEKLL